MMAFVSFMEKKKTKQNKKRTRKKEIDKK